LEFSITPELRDTLAVVREFIDREVIPLERTALQIGFEGALPELNRLRETARGMGLWAPAIPTEAGGAGLGLTEFAHLSEELGRTPFGHYVFNAQAPDIGNMELLLHHGTDEQQRRWLEPLVAGEIRSCFSMTEPGRAGSNPAWLTATASRDGDHYVLNGDKWFTTGADGAAFTIAMMITNPEAENRYVRASQIIVPTDTPGFHLVRNTPVMGEVGSGWASHAEVSFEDCRVPIANRIGDEGAGFILAQERLGPGRIHHCMRWLGICERSIDLMCDYAVNRELAPGRPLAGQQVVQHWIADSRTDVDAARLMVLRTAWKIEREGNRAARVEVSQIKTLVANTLQRVLDRALQVHGGMGMTDYTPLAWWYRHERAARIYDGADEVHRNVVARHELAKHGYPKQA
jgi:acyl-CoA dehydrogenase